MMLTFIKLIHFLSNDLILFYWRFFSISFHFPFFSITLSHNVTCNFRSRTVENCEWWAYSDHLWIASNDGQLDRAKRNSDTTSSIKNEETPHGIRKTINTNRNRRIGTQQRAKVEMNTPVYHVFKTNERSIMWPKFHWKKKTRSKRTREKKHTR